jgi:predicted N-acetyltransferase YhbS
MSVQPCEPPPALEVLPEAPSDGPQVEALLDRAFGPGRFVKVSERVREVAEFAPELSFCAVEDGRIVGTVRMWRVAVDGVPVAFLGPLAVDSGERNAGLGGLLVERACEAATAAGELAVLLVGDLAYFGRFGFDIAGGVVMPGPVDSKRVLARRFSQVELKGAVTAR